MRTALVVAAAICFVNATLHAKEVTVSVTPEMETTSDPMTLRIKITNDTEQYIAISKLQTELPPELYGSTSMKPWDQQFDLQAGYSKSIQVQVDRLPLKTRLRLAFRRPKTYQVIVSATYRNAGENVSRPTPQAEVNITPLAPAWAVFLGGAIGVVIVGAFKYLLKLNQAPASPPTATTPKWWASAALGIVVVLLSVLAFRFTASQFPDLPITVNVKDVYGGVALGLVFNTLTDFFKKALPS